MTTNRKSNHKGLFAVASDDEHDAPKLVTADPVSSAHVEKKVAKARQGKRAVMAWIPNEAFKQLKILMAHEDLTVQDVLTEALNDAFAKRGMNRLA